MYKEWSISYTQSDVDTIREQIVQDESAKRRWLLLALIITIGGLVVTVALLSTSYGLYARSVSARDTLSTENATLKREATAARQELAARTEKDEREAEIRNEAQAMLDRLRQSVLSSSASAGEIASFAKMVYGLPQGRLELYSKPPDRVFRNWKVANGETTEIYTLVGGFVDGKWVVYSNLIARR
ncbi:MAG TPA: hypothetical protein VLD57_07705 [Blastocatellia bacterium]|nr:hypothetical protein [Blastocatellia bacterium]